MRGPNPAYWRYVKHAACHWLVNFNLRLAEQVEPKRTWRIVSSDAHSTVWDGELTLFDFNFHALCIEPEAAFRLASEGGQVLKPSREIKVASPSTKPLIHLDRRVLTKYGRETRSRHPFRCFCVLSILSPARLF